MAIRINKQMNFVGSKTSILQDALAEINYKDRELLVEYALLYEASAVTQDKRVHNAIYHRIRRIIVELNIATELQEKFIKVYNHALRLLDYL
jgi:hypothetical protein